MYICYLCSQKHLLNILDFSYSKSIDDFGTVMIFFCSVLIRFFVKAGHKDTQALGYWGMVNGIRIDIFRHNIKYLMPNFRICILKECL